MENYQKMKEEMKALFRQLPEKAQIELLKELQELQMKNTKIEPKNLKNLLNERGITKGMYGNVEGFLNNEENATKRSESAFKNKSMSEAIKAIRAKRK